MFPRFTHVEACNSTLLLLFPNNIPLYGYIHILLIYASVDGRSGFVGFFFPPHFLTVMNDATMNIQSFCVDMFSILLGIYVGLELLGVIYDNFMFNTLRRCQTVFQHGCTIQQFFYILVNTYFCYLFYCSYHSRCDTGAHPEFVFLTENILISIVTF